MSLPLLARHFSQYATHGYRQPASRTSTIMMYGYLLGGFTAPFVAPAILGRSAAEAHEGVSTLGGFGGHCCSR
ncbi:hypothetical protein ABW21_db0208887 [Orbilia brochopaga]|nr:hypothetical protein ABW21_db0208887 [Drechslerella brochopaga]